MKIIQEDELKGITSMETYSNGMMKSCILNEENSISTEYGELIPQYGEAIYGERQKKYRSSIAWYKNGQIKSIALDKQHEIKTPLGYYEAELITFYENGNLKRIFPLNGKIDGFWSEEDEGNLCKSYNFKLKNGEIEAKIIGIYLYDSGALKSISLWPNEVVEVKIKDKLIEVRNGISFYENGKIKSIEPQNKLKIETPIGDIYAYDKDAIGIHGDQNSLVFSEEEEVIGITTTHSAVKVSEKDSERTQWIEPLIVDSLIEDDEKTILPLKIKFEENEIILTDDHPRSFDLETNQFRVYIPMISETMSCSDCSSCTSCS